jgi:hypothetical protein
VNQTVARYFDRDTSTAWSHDPDINVLFLTNVRNYCRDRLKARGYLFLNEVCNELQMSLTRQGQIVGWLASSDSVLDFWPEDGPKIDGDRILLEFNVDGDILDKFEKEKPS